MMENQRLFSPIKASGRVVPHFQGTDIVFIHGLATRTIESTTLFLFQVAWKKQTQAKK